MSIPKELREHLFEPCMQGPQPLDRKRGGLGLTMVKGLSYMEARSTSRATGLAAAPSSPSG
jgi:hypothetical protein